MTKRLWGAAAALFLLILLGAGGYVGWEWWARQPVGGQARIVRVAFPKGTSVNAAAQVLAEKGLIRSAAYFTRIGGHTTLKPGVYDLSPTERPARLLQHLEHGDVATTRVTFPEGFTLAQIAHRLHRLGVTPDEDAFRVLVTKHGNILKASFPLPANLEGYLFPDTYRFPVGATDAEIAQQMVNTFDRLVVRGRASDLLHSGYTLPDIVNIAAMVEREAETEADRPRIAGVIENRLKRGMKLEIDATVQYAQGIHKNRLLYSDLAIDSPYNTYRVAGLPVGPICNPGLPSLDAALHPTPSDFLYYVARPDGSHIFGRTFAEHQQNIALARRMARAAQAVR